MLLKSTEECAAEECARTRFFDGPESSYLTLFLFKLSFFRRSLFCLSMFVNINDMIHIHLADSWVCC